MDIFRTCVKGTGDVEGCLFTEEVLRFIEAMNLVECVGRKKKECFRECLNRCGAECLEMCVAAVDVAAAIAKARSLAEDVKLAAALGVDPLDAAAVAFMLELRKAVEKDCPDRAIELRILFITLVELKNLLKKQELLLLLAPLLAAEYTCVGDEVFETLEAIRHGIREEMVKRIVAALEEGALKIGHTIIQFPPIRTQ